jgi:hypothetical protein
MPAPLGRRLRSAAIALFLSFVVALSPGSSATTNQVIRIWRVGSPHTGDTPQATAASRFRQDAARHGVRVTVESFPARGFAALFADAVARNLAPDVLVFDNFGVMSGITTRLGRFDGLASDPTLRPHLIKVTDVFGDLLPPSRGWVYLFALSPNHPAAKTLALKSPPCPAASSGPMLKGELSEILPRLTAAYLEGDDITMQAESDPERVSLSRAKRERLETGEIRACGLWGNDRFAVASMNAAYEGESALGHSRVLLVLRRVSAHWRLLAASRDPITTGEFASALPGVAVMLRGNSDRRDGPMPTSAALLSPAPGVFPPALKGQRFGDFTWQRSVSADVIAEVVEFAYEDDVRLVLALRTRSGSPSSLSSGVLWHTGGPWYWRVWSISRGGDVTFSEARAFVH